MQSLFPVAPRPGTRGNSLVEFKAGKMNMVGPNADGKFQCSADKRKGSVTLVSTPDQLLHFRWTDRTSGQVVDDRIIFPGDATFKSVNTGKDEERVFVLKMNSGGAPMMFWMQDKSNEKDKENVDKLNDMMTNPASVQAAVAAAASNSGPTVGPGGTNMGPEAWAQLMGLQAPPGAGLGAERGSPAATPAAAPAPAAAPSSSSADAPPPAPSGGLDFSNLLSTLGNAPPAAPPAASTAAAGGAITADALRNAIASAQGGAGREAPLELQDIYNADAALAAGILEDEAVRAELVSHLPEGQRSEEHLETALRSPQLRDAMRMLSRALNADNYASVMANFGLDAGPGTEHLVRGEAVQAFLAALAVANPPETGTGDDTTNMDTTDE